MLINFALRRRARRAPAARAQRPAKRPARPRRPNWTSEITAASQARHRRIVSELERAEAGATVSELAATLGISRQLTLYHLKKLAARSTELVMVLEACPESGGLRYRCWDATALGLRFLEAA